MSKKVLIIGYGNPGRKDDGLGPYFVDAIERMRISGVDCESNYQLTVEDTLDIVAHDVVIFVDADLSCEGPFYFKRVRPKGNLFISSHGLSPEEVLFLAKKIYNKEVIGYILGIRGYYFNEFEESISEEGKKNLEMALSFLAPVLHSKNFEEFDNIK